MRPQAGAAEQADYAAPATRIERGAICRLSEFGQLKSAGRARRAQIAKLFIDDGILIAEWCGQVSVPQPMRIETEELDAEWMAHVRGEQWFLARRELVPTDGKMWSMQVYGNAGDAAKVNLVATLIADGGRDVFTVNYGQSSEQAHLSVRGSRDGQIMPGRSLTAPTLADLRQGNPVLFQMYLEPVLAKMVC